MYLCVLSVGLIGGRVVIMTNSKKLVVNLSESLCDEFDRALEGDNKKRSEFLREAIILYIEEKKRLAMLDSMKRGYMEMSRINLEFSDMGFASDVREFLEYEAMLSESDLSNDDGSEKRRYILC